MISCPKNINCLGLLMNTLISIPVESLKSKMYFYMKEYAITLNQHILCRFLPFFSFFFPVAKNLLNRRRPDPTHSPHTMPSGPRQRDLSTRQNSTMQTRPRESRVSSIKKHKNPLFNRFFFPFLYSKVVPLYSSFCRKSGETTHIIHFLG